MLAGTCETYLFRISEKRESVKEMFFVRASDLA
jgi:hypothetical protein